MNSAFFIYMFIMLVSAAGFSLNMLYFLAVQHQNVALPPWHKPALTIIALYLLITAVLSANEMASGSNLHAWAWVAGGWSLSITTLMAAWVFHRRDRKPK